MAQAGDDQKRYPMLMLMDLHRPKYYTLPSGTEYLQYTHRSQVPAVHFHSIYPAIPSHPIPSHSIHPTASLDIKPDKPLNHRIIDPTFLIKGIPCNTIFISPVVKHMQSSNRARFPDQGNPSAVPYSSYTNPRVHYKDKRAPPSTIPRDARRCKTTVVRHFF